jgi:hypothetical protein
MHESIRPVAGAIVLRALMGVRFFWPYNMIGLGGLVIDQASKRRSLPASHQFTPRIRFVAHIGRGFAELTCAHSRDGDQPFQAIAITDSR